MLVCSCDTVINFVNNEVNIHFSLNLVKYCKCQPHTGGLNISAQKWSNDCIMLTYS